MKRIRILLMVLALIAPPLPARASEPFTVAARGAVAQMLIILPNYKIY